MALVSLAVMKLLPIEIFFEQIIRGKEEERSGSGKKMVFRSLRYHNKIQLIDRPVLAPTAGAFCTCRLVPEPRRAFCTSVF